LAFVAPWETITTMSPAPTDNVTLLVGFDSAWTPGNSGALVGLVRSRDGQLCELGPPEIADFRAAEKIIAGWQ
jgi:hypothetical protein